MRKIFGYLLISGALLWAGCADRVGKFTAISTKNIGGLEYADSGKSEGEDCGHTIIIFTTSNPDMETAVREALAKKNADLLIDTVISRHHFYFPLIFGYDCYKVEGTAVNTMKKSPIRTTEPGKKIETERKTETEKKDRTKR